MVAARFNIHAAKVIKSQLDFAHAKHVMFPAFLSVNNITGIRS